MNTLPKISNKNLHTIRLYPYNKGGASNSSISHVLLVTSLHDTMYFVQVCYVCRCGGTLLTCTFVHSAVFLIVKTAGFFLQINVNCDKFEFIKAWNVPMYG
jgi:hypothetical protein